MTRYLPLLTFAVFSLLLVLLAGRALDIEADTHPRHAGQGAK